MEVEHRMRIHISMEVRNRITRTRTSMEVKDRITRTRTSMEAQDRITRTHTSMEAQDRITRTRTINGAIRDAKGKIYLGTDEGLMAVTGVNHAVHNLARLRFTTRRISLCASL